MRLLRRYRVSEILKLFWMRWPQLSAWAGSLWRLLSEELAGPSSPHDESELFEIGESG